MCCTHPELALALMELRVEEARQAVDAQQRARAAGQRLGRQAGQLLAQIGTRLVSLGKQLAHTTRVQPSI
jgi:hypothetical protein